MAADRWICLDVGETLIDETRIWGAWADELEVPRLTFFAALGAVIAEGREHGEVFGLFGLPTDSWQVRSAAVEARHGGFSSADLYPDALRALDRLRSAGHRLAIIANQPARRHRQLLALGVKADVMAMSEELGIAKPDPAFFRVSLELMGSPHPADVAYVGDRVDNDVLPAIAAGMRSVWIRRGPWGRIQPLPEGVRPALIVDTLDELVDRIGEAFAR
jgi:FMN hydrolase / 5-amino-6-(5-phospho-D-ribitylamino)uracil phosphatase